MAGMDGRAQKMLQFENWDLIENCYTKTNSDKVEITMRCLSRVFAFSDLFHFHF